MMNLPSDRKMVEERNPGSYAAAASGNDTLSAFAVQERSVSPFEFRSITYRDSEEFAAQLEAGGVRRGVAGKSHSVESWDGIRGDAGVESAAREAALRSAVEAARTEAMQAGEREGRRAARVELEAELNAAVLRERARINDVVQQFRAARDRYFADVEQEVVKLALAIAGRVLHREVQIDPLLLAGVVRVALEKMADRSGVVLRVATGDVEAWERIFHAMEVPERPRVAEDSGLKRGECVLETRMGTVELGVQVQLEEIEKGFFDLLNHRPAE